MVENYITLSLETHLFFARIMKEHALFIEAGFPCKDRMLIQQADSFRQQFEKLLSDVVRVSQGQINAPILQSNELITEFTIPAERRTEHLSGIPIDTSLSEMEKKLQAGVYREERSEMLQTGVCREERSEMLQTGVCRKECAEMLQTVHCINKRALRLLDGIIAFKEHILQELESCRLFSFNYPLLIRHILREARLYRSTIDNLMHDRQVSYVGLWGTEAFWNQIMMEHALFIRGLLDPVEEQLIDTADQFADDYKRLLEQAKEQDRKANGDLYALSLTETLKYRDFKAAGTQGILKCEIASVILPLLADHVLREANHYIRILQCARP